MRLSTHRLSAIVACVVAACLVAAACGPPVSSPTTTTTPVPGAVDVTGGLIAEAWRVGVPVDVPIYWPGHPTAEFAVVGGFVPPGVELAGGRFVGTPTGGGFFVANLELADGAVTQKVWVRFGVVQSAPLASLRLPSNPFRGEVVIRGCLAASETYCEDSSEVGYFDSGATTPTPHDTYSTEASASSLRDPVFYRPLLVGGRFVSSSNETGDCVVNVQDLNAGGDVPPIETMGVGLTAVTECRVESDRDGSIYAIRAVGADSSGAVVTRMVVARLSDGTELRRLDRGPGTKSFLSRDGRTLVVSNGQTLELVGQTPSLDRSFNVGDADGRSCGPSESTFGMIRIQAGSRIALLCETPGQGLQIGYLDTDSAEVWLSEMTPSVGMSSPSLGSTPSQLFLAPYAGVSISPDGTQLAAAGGSYIGPTQCALPGAFCGNKLVPVAVYVDTTGDGIIREAFPSYWLSSSGFYLFGFAADE
jgi:hypothetical protein